jgi:hypothetical protein
MSKAIVIGGVLGLIGGGAMLLQLLLHIGPGELGWILNLIIISIVILGGILGVARKKAAGGILLVMGILLVLLGALSYITVTIDLLPYSGFAEISGGHTLNNLVAGIPLEAFIILIGAVIILASPRD